MKGIKSLLPFYSGYVLIIISLCIYSYALVDPNLTLFNNALWAAFRENLIYLGYFQRQTSWNIYLGLIILLFVFHFISIRFYKNVKLKVILPIISILLLSYPFLSHDVFNYMFDARIFTYYHQNPYLHSALDFPQDGWLRFLQWVHRPYPYGPSFLPITIIPSFLSFGKFITNFFLFKLTFFIFYYLAVFFLYKINKKWSIVFATHPLVLIEGVINTHNDLMSVSLGIIGLYFVFKDIQIPARILFLLSAGIKYLSFPVIFLTKNNHLVNRVIFFAQIGLIVYLSISRGVQPWYFLGLLLFIPIMEKFLLNSSIFFFGLLLSYYPFIRLGGWDTKEKVALQHSIILVSLAINMVVWIYNLFKGRDLIGVRKNNS